MGASTEHFDLQAISGGGDYAGAVADHTGGPDHNVLPKYHIRFENTPEESVINHCPGAFACFLCGLKERHQGASPGVSMLREQSSRSDQPGHVHVMSAGMHHGYGFPIPIGAGHFACIGQAGRLKNRQRIHVCPEHDGWTVPILQYPDYSSLSDASSHIETSGTEMLCGDARRPLLLHR